MAVEDSAVAVAEAAPALAVLAEAALAVAAPVEAGRQVQILLNGIRRGGPEEKETV